MSIKSTKLKGLVKKSLFACFFILSPWNLKVNGEDSLLDKVEKNASQLGQQLSKITPNRVYFIYGVSYNEIKRNEIGILSKIHSDNQKKNFLYIMQGKHNLEIEGNKEYKQGFAYSLDLKTDDGKKYNELPAKQLEDMFDYYSHIFSETALCSDGVKFKVFSPQIWTNKPSSGNMVKAIGYITKVNTLFDTSDRGQDNILNKTKALMWNNNITPSLWKNGISTYSGIEDDNDRQNIDRQTQFKYIKGRAVETTTENVLPEAFEILRRKDPAENNFLTSLIPHCYSQGGLFSSNDDISFFIYDRNLNLYKMEYNKLNKELDKMKLIYVDMKKKASDNAQSEHDKHNKEKSTNNKEIIDKNNKEASTVQEITVDKFINNNNDFPRFEQNSNYLAFLYLNLQTENDTPIGESMHRITKIIEPSAQERETVYNFNRKTLDKNMFFLFGYQGQDINNATLPNIIYERHINKANDEKDKTKEKEKQPEDSNAIEYNVPTYERKRENINMIERAITNLPQTSPLQVNQCGGFVGVMAIFGKICAVVSLEYLFTLNKEAITPINKDLSQLYGSLIAAYEIINNKEHVSHPNIYIGPSLMLNPAQCILNKYADMLFGLALILYTLNLLFIFKVHYNIYNNTWIITASVGGKTLFYGEEEYLDPDITNRTVKMEILTY